MLDGRKKRLNVIQAMPHVPADAAFNHTDGFLRVLVIGQLLDDANELAKQFGQRQDHLRAKIKTRPGQLNL